MIGWRPFTLRKLGEFLEGTRTICVASLRGLRTGRQW